MRRILALFLVIFTMMPGTVLADDSASPAAHCERAQPKAPSSRQFAAAEQVLEPDTDYRAIFCTSAGAIYVDLYEKLTPITVNNFVFLAQQGYYDGTSFHRVIPGFMAQGGDPTGTGRGGPGYRFGDEPIGFLTFDRPGLLAMANAGPGTNGSQFFITTAPTPHLNYKHTIFGDALMGQDIVDAIRERDPQTATSEGEALHSLLIISDPAAVDSPPAPSLPPASRDEIAASFVAFASSLPDSLPLDEERSGAFSTDDLAATVSDELRDAFLAFADEHGHEFRQRAQFSNADCADSIFFSSLGYWVDVYADPAAAATDAFMREWLESYGYQAQDGVYIASAPSCDGGPGVHLLSLRTIGRFLVTLDLLVSEAILEQASPAQILYNLALQIDAGFASIYLPELRA